MTDWDRRCGFADGDDVVGARRREDEEALARLRATPVWLDFLDHQYGPRHSPEELVEALENAIGDAETVTYPIGLFHEDHVMTAVACTGLATRSRDRRWVVYEDAIYRPVPGRTDTALEALRERGLEPVAVSVPAAGSAKREAISAYRSQVLGLGDLLSDAYEPEHYWELARR